MTFLKLLPLIFLFACASRPDRDIASYEQQVFGEVDGTQSIIKLFPPNHKQEGIYHFYLELRDKNKKLIDSELQDIRIKYSAGILTTRMRRIALGKYEVEVAKDSLEIKKLKFEVQKKTIKHDLKTLSRASKKFSRITVISNQDYTLGLRLTLKDEEGRYLNVPQGPEVILDEMYEVSTLKQVKMGVWEFSVKYPDQNFIFYASVRANGITLEKLFRFQHVEK